MRNPIKMLLHFFTVLLNGAIIEEKGQVGFGGIIDLFISIMIVFYVLSALIGPTETAVSDVTYVLENSTFSEVQNISELPKVSYLIALIMVIVGLIYAGWGRQ